MEKMTELPIESRSPFYLIVDSKIMPESHPEKSCRVWDLNSCSNPQALSPKSSFDSIPKNHISSKLIKSRIIRYLSIILWISVAISILWTNDYGTNSVFEYLSTNSLIIHLQSARPLISQFLIVNPAFILSILAIIIQISLVILNLIPNHALFSVKFWSFLSLFGAIILMDSPFIWDVSQIWFLVGSMGTIWAIISNYYAYTSVNDPHKFDTWMPYYWVGGKVRTIHPMTGEIRNGLVMRITPFLLSYMRKSSWHSRTNKHPYVFLGYYLGTIPDFSPTLKNAYDEKNL
ncbi:MAG: hypothetical protein ACTSVZ_03705 [Promethearchaeota archaeon]